MSENRHDTDQALVLFTAAFATLIEAGVSLMRSLSILQHHAPAPYNTAAEELMAPIESGATLSQTMARRPDRFSPFYVALVRVGEIGGILDETLRIVADALAADRRLASAAGSLLLPSAPALPREWVELGERQRRLALMLFCRSLGAMLSAGVPPGLALETAALLLPAAEREAAQAAAASVADGRLMHPLLRAGFLPPLVVHLMAIGEECGTLDRMLEKAAEVYEFELEQTAAG